MTDSSPIRVMLVDDSAVVRGLLAKALETLPGFDVVATAMRGDLALRKLSQVAIDAMVLDVEMPVMDGLSTLKQLRVDYPHLPVIMFSSMTSTGAAASVRALALGAAECVLKPKNNRDELQSAIAQLTRVLEAVCGRRPNAPAKAHRESSTTRRSAVTGAAAKSTAAQTRTVETMSITADPRKKLTLPPKLLVIGSSTGGPAALTEVLSRLPRDFSIPTLIVQHMPASFTPLLAKHLEQDTHRPCFEVEDGMIANSGSTYVAPGGFHVTVHAHDDGYMLKLNEDPAEHFCRPSVNPLFRTAAVTVRERLLAVMLTGMGSDGLEGTRDVVAAGGYVLAQDEASSVVWGMPGAIVQESLAHQVLPLNQIASKVTRLCSQETCYA